MATILIDYENVGASNGLKGVEYLKETDSLYIFYSQCCGKIRAEYIEAIEKSGCEFHIYKLVKTGKNALDFYIASQCGIISQSGETQIAIISKDKGLVAVTDFFKIREDVPALHVVTASSVENGILALNAKSDQNRRDEVQEKAKMLDIGQEYAKYTERIAFKQRLAAALKGTEYEFMTEQVLKMMEDTNALPKKELYTGSLHNFGKKNGCAIYHLLKDVV